MKERAPIISFSVTVIILAAAAFAFMILSEKPVAVVFPEDASLQEKLAAREIRRYLYLRTGILAKMAAENEFVSPFSDIVYVSHKNKPAAQSLTKEPEMSRMINSLEPEHYLITTSSGKFRRVIHVIGGDDTGTLYGAYRLAEHLGVRFFLHGDVIPDKKTEAELPDIHEAGKPYFKIRGIHPFHDFPEGPDWWNADDYKAVVAQLPKLRMNFFGLHTYPEGGPNAEPTVWIGLPEDTVENGGVRFSYQSSYQNTMRGNWGYTPKQTENFLFGGSLLFERDDYGNDVMSDLCPAPKTLKDCNELFRRAGRVLGDVFLFARSLGIKTCIGTETPLTIPKQVGERLISMGKNPADSAVVQELYEGMFKRIKETTPVDYYWFWTPEGWTWGGNTDKQVKATLTDLNAAIKARDNVMAPFELATCGWVLGPRNDRAFFHKYLPVSMPMSCINRGVGTVAVDRSFARISGRPKWAIPWLEDDPGLTSAQLWVGRMRSDAVDALRYGCTGLLGIHWRTRILGPNTAALAGAAWNHEPWIKKPRVSGALEGYVMIPANRDIRGTVDDLLYQTGRHNVFNCRFEVPNGTYSVKLKFCETEHSKRGARVFDVYIQDRKVVEGLDIFARAGSFRALGMNFEDVSVSDGFMDIVFDPSAGQACISALEIQGKGISVKRNFGGQSYEDFEADSALKNRSALNRDYLNGISLWEYTPARHFGSGDFYDDWAFHLFGPEVSNEIARIFERMDGAMPRSSDWIGGPGGWRPDSTPWAARAGDYAFTGELENLRGRISGKGNIERFDYWLNNFRFMKSSAHLCCVWAEFDSAMETVTAEGDKFRKAEFAREKALPLYSEMVSLLGETYGYLLGFVSNYGEMGTVANVEQHILPGLLIETGKQLAEALGGELPENVRPSREYKGEPRLIVPTVRSSYSEGESLELKVVVLDTEKPAQAEICWREMGTESFETEKLTHLGRGVFRVRLPLPETGAVDLEYYVRAVTSGGKELVFPATAPQINQTVVVVER